MTTKAIVLAEPGRAEIQEVPIPKLRDGYLLVKVRAVALNPTDIGSVDKGRAGVGCRIGCDYAGVVEEVGPNVTGPFKKGDRVAGLVHGGDRTQHENGAFGYYALAKADAQIIIPDNLSFEEAATLPVSVITVGQGLYKALKLPLPSPSSPAAQPARSDAPLVFIYGGSTATATYGIQFAALSGYRVITTASPSHHDFVRSLGASAVFDYHDPDCAGAIRRWVAESGQPLRLAWDCISRPDSAVLCASVLSDDEEGGTYAVLLPVEREAVASINPHIKGPFMTLGYDALGEPHERYGKRVVPDEDELPHAKMFWAVARELLAKGLVKPIRQVVNRGGSGLEGVLKGLDELRNGKVSGEKLVYTL
ncbi:chaperonin 10-like protein [Xylariales sp. PMI_506]|nr:chaperonin 10-like protein [Xylariales sp. PMI_506]